MGEMARDVMDTRFHTLRPQMTVAEAVKIFQRASEESGRRVFGMLVVDDGGCLAGMLSVYDIFLCFAPSTPISGGKWPTWTSPDCWRRPVTGPNPFWWEIS